MSFAKVKARHFLRNDHHRHLHQEVNMLRGSAVGRLVVGFGVNMLRGSAVGRLVVGFGARPGLGHCK